MLLALRDHIEGGITGFEVRKFTEQIPSEVAGARSEF
jgi:hypothetical protein